jgi:murein L,D-transpeptidase YafK
MKNFIVALFALTLSGCSIVYDRADPRRGLAPQSTALINASESVDTKATSPVLIRIFKQSNELELWRKNSKGYYVLVNTFTVCAYSGDLGPKKKQGDRQAPEGFYTIGASQLNYHSIRFLSLDTGFPNAYDRSHKSTGSSLMIHGGCDSAGCYAIEDAPMQDLFAAVRDALHAGQKSVQLHVYPFRMSAINMLVNQDNQHDDFWHQLKQGYDKFDLTRQELNVTVVNKRYIIN